MNWVEIQAKRIVKMASRTKVPVDKPNSNDWCILLTAFFLVDIKTISFFLVSLFFSPCSCTFYITMPTTVSSRSPEALLCKLYRYMCIYIIPCYINRYANSFHYKYSD
jgi:hypothetical protein